MEQTSTRFYNFSNFMDSMFDVNWNLSEHMNGRRPDVLLTVILTLKLSSCWGGIIIQSKKKCFSRTTLSSDDIFLALLVNNCRGGDKCFCGFSWLFSMEVETDSNLWAETRKAFSPARKAWPTSSSLSLSLLPSWCQHIVCDNEVFD